MRLEDRVTIQVQLAQMALQTQEMEAVVLELLMPQVTDGTAAPV
jgi:hypothetical protein